MSWSHIPFNSLSSYGHALSLFSFSSILIPSRRMPIVLETFTCSGEKIFLDLQYQLRSVHKLVLLVVILCPSLHREHCHNLLTCQGGVMKQRPLKSDCLCYYFVSSHIYPSGLKSWLSKILKLTKGRMRLNFCQRQLHARILLKFVKSTILDVHLSCQPCNNKSQTNCCFGTSYQPRQLNKRKKWK